MQHLDAPIDFVVLWVDSTDVKWQEEMSYWLKQESGQTADVDNARYRDWGIFKFWFRCVEKNAPWVRKVHLVTNGQVPDFLELDNTKIQLDVHQAFMKSNSLPTFNSHPIELQIPYIEDLAEQFVYFNDDMFLMKPVSPEHFFKNGKRVELFCERSFLRYYDSIFYRIIAKNRKVLNQITLYNKRKIIKEIGLKKWFSFKLPLNYWLSNLFYFIFSRKFVGFSIEHGAAPLLKSECIECISAIKSEYEVTIECKFREPNKINQYIFRYWSIINGSYVIEQNAGCCFYEISDIKRIKRGFEKGFKFPIICLNDSSHIDNFDVIKNEINILFSKAYPEKSCFEK